MQTSYYLGVMFKRDRVYFDTTENNFIQHLLVTERQVSTILYYGGRPRNVLFILMYAFQ